jgi:hypothetical protein
MAAAEIVPGADPSDLPDVLEVWRNAIEGLNVYRGVLAEEGRTDLLAFGLDRIRELRRQLGDLERAVEADIAELMDGKTETIDGLGTLERRRGTDRKAWQSDDLLKVIVRQAVDPEGTGEVAGTPIEVLGRVLEAITACVPVTPSLGWRVTALRSHGVDPDEWCETKPGRTAVQIHKAETAA